MPAHRPTEPDSPFARARHARLVDRYELNVALLVATWTAGFVLRGRLAQTDRLTDVANEALLSLLYVVPILLLAWGALVAADRRFKLGLFVPRGRR